MFHKLISPNLLPTFSKDDYLLSLKTLFSPHKFFQTEAKKQVENWFKTKYPSYQVILGLSGRSLLEVYLKNVNLPSASQVLVQALTCSVVPGAIIKSGLKPVFVDVTDTFNMDKADLAKKITPLSKVLIIQHSFGHPDNLEKIQSFCRQHKLILIEDCAHCLGVNYQNKPLGSFGDASFFSFGRDKVISSVWGGALLVKDKSIYQKINQTKFINKNIFWVSQQLLYPSIIFLVTNLYSFLSIGKIIHYISQITGLITKAVSFQDKNLIDTPFYSYPNQLAILALNQLNKLDLILEKRRYLAKSYSQIFDQKYYPDSGYLRYSLVIKDKSNFKNLLKKSNIIAGDWYYQPVIPDINLTRFGYTKNSCPNAELISQSMLNLPTNPSLNQTDTSRLLSSIKHANNYTN